MNMVKIIEHIVFHKHTHQAKIEYNSMHLSQASSSLVSNLTSQIGVQRPFNACLTKESKPYWTYRIWKKYIIMSVSIITLISFSKDLLEYGEDYLIYFYSMQLPLQFGIDSQQLVIFLCM